MSYKSVWYTPSDDLCIITTYYNPCKYATRKRNFEIFSKPILESGMSFIAVEMALEDEEFDLGEEEWIVKVRAKDIMWQKERLLNIALQYVPEKCTKIAWIDADVLFGDPDWAIKASEALDKHAVIQLFDRMTFLDNNNNPILETSEDRPRTSFCAQFQIYPQACATKAYNIFGHTGLAWAIRRSIVDKHGFYDVSITGSGDALMAHAFAGSFEMAKSVPSILQSSHHFNHYVQWSEKVYEMVRANIWCISGEIIHFWHGTKENRNLIQRHNILGEIEFSPERDLHSDKYSPLAWISAPDGIHDKMYLYFKNRKEDEI